VQVRDVSELFLSYFDPDNPIYWIMETLPEFPQATAVIPIRNEPQSSDA
jgi:hypothetical protein